MAVCAIDGPVHGDRRGDGEAGVALQFLEFAQRWANDPGLTDEMVDDWRETLDALTSSGELADDVRVGYWGLSMGTILGLPYVAADSRVSAAVLGLAGVAGPTGARLESDAAKVVVPTMFLAQWDDELFARDRVLALFSAIAASDKQLIATPGAHAAVTSESFRRSAEFLADRLGAAQGEK
jgi:dienelactone hydrolase